MDSSSRSRHTQPNFDRENRDRDSSERRKQSRFRSRSPHVTSSRPRRRRNWPNPNLQDEVVAEFDLNKESNIFDRQSDCDESSPIPDVVGQSGADAPITAGESSSAMDLRKLEYLFCPRQNNKSFRPVSEEQFMRGSFSKHPLNFTMENITNNANPNNDNGTNFDLSGMTMPTLPKSLAETEPSRVDSIPDQKVLDSNISNLDSRQDESEFEWGYYYVEPKPVSYSISRVFEPKIFRIPSGLTECDEPPDPTPIISNNKRSRFQEVLNIEEIPTFYSPRSTSRPYHNPKHFITIPDESDEDNYTQFLQNTNNKVHVVASWNQTSPGEFDTRSDDFDLSPRANLDNSVSDSQRTVSSGGSLAESKQSASSADFQESSDTDSKVSPTNSAQPIHSTTVSHESQLGLSLPKPNESKISFYHFTSEELSPEAVEPLFEDVQRYATEISKACVTIPEKESEVSVVPSQENWSQPDEDTVQQCVQSYAEQIRNVSAIFSELIAKPHNSEELLDLKKISDTTCAEIEQFVQKYTAWVLQCTETVSVSPCERTECELPSASANFEMDPDIVANFSETESDLEKPTLPSGPETTPADGIQVSALIESQNSTIEIEVQQQNISTQVDEPEEPEPADSKGSEEELITLHKVRSSASRPRSLPKPKEANNSNAKKPTPNKLQAKLNFVAKPITAKVDKPKSKSTIKKLTIPPAFLKTTTTQSPRSRPTNSSYSNRLKLQRELIEKEETAGKNVTVERLLKWKKDREAKPELKSRSTQREASRKKN